MKSHQNIIIPSYILCIYLSHRDFAVYLCVNIGPATPIIILMTQIQFHGDHKIVEKSPKIHKYEELPQYYSHLFWGMYNVVP